MPTGADCGVLIRNRGVARVEIVLMTAVGDKYGPYTCVRRIGEGGMAETFLANQSGPYGFEQRVCIKLIREEFKNNPKLVEMFFQEATIAASLRHSNIVSVIDASQQDAYMVLELVDGVDLRTLLQAAPGNRLAPEQVIYIAVELVKALDFAHNRRLHGKPDGVVHRDIKPSNILVSYAGEVKLADFGIAKAIRSTSDTDGLLRGTPYYMSPEQLTRRPLDARSDLFSLGVVLYELLAGRHPFAEQGGHDTIERIANGKLTPLSEAAYKVPAGLAVVVERLLRHDPDERFESARAFGETLDKFAPAPGVYRNLGQLARNARPPETLLPAQETGSPAMPHAVRQETHAQELQASLSDGNGTATMANPDSELEPIPADPKQSTRSGRLRQPLPATQPRETPIESPYLAIRFRIKPLILLATAFAVAAATAVLIAVTDRSKTVENETVPTSDPTSNRSSNRQRSSPPATDEAVVLSHDRYSETIVSSAELKSDPTNPPSEQSDLSRSGVASALQSPNENPVKRTTARVSDPQGEGIVRVGVFPWGKVWIDDRFVGSAPISVELVAGKHLVAGGIDKPLVSKSIKLKAGTAEQVVINLNKDDR